MELPQVLEIWWIPVSLLLLQQYMIHRRMSNVFDRFACPGRELVLHLYYGTVVLLISGGTSLNQSVV